MPRRASSGISAGQIAGLAIGIIFIIAVIFILIQVLTGGFGGLGLGGENVRRTASSDLELRDYLENANAMRGNTYNLSGTVEERLKWTPTGRIISLDVSQGADSSPVPVLIPEEFNHVNIEKGADLNFVVEVIDNGMLIARSVTPS